MADCPEIVLEDLRFLQEEIKKIGLSINPGKCELTLLNLDNPEPVINNFKELLPNLKITPINETIILESPLLHRESDLKLTRGKMHLRE